MAGGPDSPPFRLHSIRALSFKVDTASPVENFAVHLQGSERSDVHIIDEALIPIGKRPTFPSSLWPVVEGLCDCLSKADLRGGAGAAVRAAAQETVEALASRGEEELAQVLSDASRRSFNRPLNALLLFVVSRNRRLGMLQENALRKILALFESALGKLVRGDDRAMSSATEVGRYYEARIGQIGQSCCFPTPPLPHLNGKPANLYPDAPFLSDHPKDATKGHLLEREALMHGLTVLRFPNGSFFAYDAHGKRLNFKWSRSPVSSAVSLALCNHKEATKARLARCGLPVARGRVFASHDHDEIAAYAARIGYPVVCKPAAGVRGIGVTTHIQNESELNEALALHAKSPLGLDDVILEQHVEGTDYRIVVVGREVVSAVCRETAFVVGTGKHTVFDLLVHKNRIRWLNPHLRRRLIQFDEAAKYQLHRAGLTLDSVPEPGRWVQLANSNNISRGGDSVEVLDELHDSVKEAAVRAVEAIPGLGFCGLDVMLEDHAKPIDQQTAAIVELNAHGAIGTGQYPMWGMPRNVARHFLRHCAEREGVAFNNSPFERLSLRIKVRGRVTRIGYRNWFHQKAEEFGVNGWIENVDRHTVEAALEGNSAPVAALVNAAVRGPRWAIPYWVKADHAPPQRYQGFEIR